MVAKVNQSQSEGRGKKGLQNSVKAKPPIDTQKELASIAGVSHDTIAKVKVIEAKATPEIKEKLAAQERKNPKHFCSGVISRPAPKPAKTRPA